MTSYHIYFCLGIPGWLQHLSFSDKTHTVIIWKKRVISFGEVNNDFQVEIQFFNHTCMILKYTLGLSQRTNACFFFTEFTSIISGTQLTASVVKTISNFPNSGEKKNKIMTLWPFSIILSSKNYPTFSLKLCTGIWGLIGSYASLHPILPQEIIIYF